MDDSKHDDGVAAVVAELARLRDELRDKIPRAGSGARETWAEVQPSLHELDQRLGGVDVGVAQTLHAAAAALRQKLQQLRDDVTREQEPA